MRGIGIPWPVLSVILSVPQVHEFEVQGRLFHSLERLPQSDPPPWPANLTSFRYTPNFLRPEPRNCASENDVLALILERLCGSLESLTMPSECAPFALMNQWDWPRLRELTIEGQAVRVLKLRAPLVSVLSSMPRLRALTLKFAYSYEEKLPAIWPPEEDRAGLPWPNLETLTITWAHPDDRIFDNLPASLRYLSLRTWPRSYGYQMRRLHGWREKSTLWSGRELSDSDVLRVLRGCRGTALERLELEYEADVQDLALLRFIPGACPNLRVLHLHRNRALGDLSAIPVEEITDLVYTLPRLRILRLYLDFRHTAQHYLTGAPYIPATEYEPVADATVAAVARKAGPSLKYLCMLASFGASARWRIFRLERGTDGRTEARYEHAPVDSIEGYDRVTLDFLPSHGGREAKPRE
ncbi:hypothetical protein BV20DRAFT_973027 [Pilatotrama ljubarskyi]|nr:hypothetical protein BV20DRAFT_973027 [Pilatotrama ljubarskyi]